MDVWWMIGLDWCVWIVVGMMSGCLLLLFDGATLFWSRSHAERFQQRNRRATNETRMVKSKSSRAPGIEPGSPEWQSGMLPLYHARIYYNTKVTFFSEIWAIFVFCCLVLAVGLRSTLVNHQRIDTHVFVQSSAHWQQTQCQRLSILHHAWSLWVWFPWMQVSWKFAPLASVMQCSSWMPLVECSTTDLCQSCWTATGHKCAEWED